MAVSKVKNDWAEKVTIFPGFKGNTNCRKREYKDKCSGFNNIKSFALSQKEIRVPHQLEREF